MIERPGRKMDWMTFSLYLALVGIGWLMIYTVDYGDGYDQSWSSFLFDTLVGKQTIWIGIAFITFFFVFLLDRKFWQTFAYPIYGLALLSLVAVLFLGKEIKGATSWFSFGGFTLQPSEFAKFATNIALAAFASTYSTNFKTIRHQLVGAIILLVPMGLILLQPDAGSALVFFGFLVVMYREGLPGWYFSVGFTASALLLLGFVFDPLYIVACILAIGALLLVWEFPRRAAWLLGWGGLMVGGIFAIQYGYFTQVLIGLGAAVLILLVTKVLQQKMRTVALVVPALVLASGLVFLSDFSFNNLLKPHQQDRINVWLNPQKSDPQGSLYNVLQSKMAIGSGGLEGKGFLKGNLTKGNYVPEQSTDFIFCTIGEEQGFIGSVGIIGLFILLLVRITILAERQRSSFARCYAYGVAGVLFIHFFINIGMTMGLMPIIGIPLPFISKGGSALVGFTILISILLKLDRHRYSL
jgi:rod shape determining protein RodA